jgi:hypothetical protein
MKQDTPESKTKIVEGIVKHIKKLAQDGNTSYMYQHMGGFKAVFPDPHELVTRLQEILVDVDVVYAEPYISVRWN